MSGAQPVIAFGTGDGGARTSGSSREEERLGAQQDPPEQGRETNGESEQLHWKGDHKSNAEDSSIHSLASCPHLQRDSPECFIGPPRKGVELLVEKLFRLRIIGADTSDTERLILAGLEFNGILLGDSLAEDARDESSGRKFQYAPASDGESSGDEGFFTYLSRGNDPETAANPALLGHIRLVASEFLTAEQDLFQLLDPTPSMVETTAKPDSWISFSLPERQKFSVTSYRLNPLPGSDTPPLDEWVLEGSNNGENWEILHDGTGSDPDAQDNTGFVWELPKDLTPYRHLRIRMVGTASAEGTALKLAGVEFWGDFSGDQFNDPLDFDPPCSGQTFTYQEDFDGNGITAYLGTDDGTHPYRNPAVLGRVKTRASSLMNDSQPAYSIVGNAVVRCLTKAEQNAWFEVDFGGNRIIPNHYSLRHYSSFDTEALRNWVLEASNDGQTGSLCEAMSMTPRSTASALRHRGQSRRWTHRSVSASSA